MATSFVPLRLRSRHTLFSGTIAPGALPAGLAHAGFAAGALLDRHSLRGAIEFYEACLAEGVKPIVGADLTCPVTGLEIGAIALDRDGYANLSKAITSANLRPERTLLEAIEESPDGLAILAPDVGTALRIREAVGRDRVWLEVVANRLGASAASAARSASGQSRSASRALTAHEALAAREALQVARKNGLPAVATWDVVCLNAEDRRLVHLLRAIGEDRTLDQVRLTLADPSLAASKGLAGMFGERPDMLGESLRLAEMADLKLDLGKAHFPRLTGSAADSFARLETMCRDAMRTKYEKGRDDAARARLAEELATIGTLGMADYFLVVADIVGFAARERIRVTGRGSGAGSIVAYLLGITQADPVAEGLLFERFLNELRPDYPDLDIDVSWKRRDEVIDYVYRRFGHDRVAMISTCACFEARSAARETAKAFGLSPYEAQALADRLPYHASEDTAGSIARALAGIRPELGPRERDEIGRLAAAIVGFPNHSSVHCGGIVVSDREIAYYTPLEIAAKGIQVTQFDMNAIERIGLIKIDLLGNRALSIVEEACEDVARHGTTVGEIPPGDPKTAQLLKSGRTLTCFQLESPAMRSLISMMKADARSEATLALALVRPGPAAGGMKQRFLESRAGGTGRAGPRSPGKSGRPERSDPPQYFPVYEEDVMRITAAATGISLAEADIFRRWLKDGRHEESALGEKFMFLARSAGRSNAEAEAAWMAVKRFARYTFCKAHAISFGVIAYASAYLKANFPLEFYAAALRNHSGMYPLWVHVNEARRFGVEVMLPSVNRSFADFSIENGKIRTGLSSVSHLSHGTIRALVAAKACGEFRSLSDFLSRVSADKEEVSSLIASGAFDGLERQRCRSFTEYLAMRGKLRSTGSPTLGFGDVETGLPIRAFTLLQERKMEYAALGFSPLVHPLEFFDGDGSPECRPGPQSSRATAGSVSLRGLLAALRHYKEKGPGLWFLSLDDEQGVHECILPDDVRKPRLDLGNAYECTGKVQRRFGTPTIRVHSIRMLEERG